jgi:hypothetical protein
LLELNQALIRSDKRLLCEVLCPSGIPNQSVAEIPDVGTIPPVDLFERTLIPLTGFDYQIVIEEIGVPSFPFCPIQIGRPFGFHVAPKSASS